MRYFSVAYRPLDWPLPGFMEAVSTRPAGPGVTDLSVDHPAMAGRDDVLGEYATLFAVRRVLQESFDRGECSEQEMVGISHYRRFAVARPTGSRQFVYGVVRPEEFATLPRDLFVPDEQTLLCPMPHHVQPSVLGHYGTFHHTRDLLFFMAIAIDLGLVTNDQATAWMSGDVMIPAPAVGVYPAGWLVEVLAALEHIVAAFEATVAVPRTGYQRRVIAFCLERLHGLLLSSLVSKWPQEAAIVNPALIVSPDGQYRASGRESDGVDQQELVGAGADR